MLATLYYLTCSLRLTAVTWNTIINYIFKLTIRLQNQILHTNLQQKVLRSKIKVLIKQS